MVDKTTGYLTGEKTCNRNLCQAYGRQLTLVGIKIKTRVIIEIHLGSALAIIFKYVVENFEGVIAKIDSANKAWKKLDELGNYGGL
ncbi:hypothetical protein PR048_010066 [Dryococelus australis]|uniref:Uncharacterized protein n=1 Tax=Dryococelus australis TaxID=614101 RepID=A0ABQ9I228_9NEOP|nr:hypothetical protein PR048_010066 [Dryococelus australis]